MSSRSLWEAVHAFVAGRDVVTQSEVLRQFHRDDEELARGVLQDLVETGLVFRTGKGGGARYRAVRGAELSHEDDDVRREALDTLLGIIVYRTEPADRAKLRATTGFPEAVLDACLSRLVESGRVELDRGFYRSRSLVLPVGSAVGFEAAIFDHYQALVSTLCAKIAQGGPPRPNDHVGAFRIDVTLLGALLFLVGGCTDGGDRVEAREPVNTGGCPTFDSTFAAIQATIFERKGCTADACHGSSKQAGLDLRAGASYGSLVNANSEGSDLRRVEPRSVGKSYLFQKLAARTDESLVTSPIAGQPMPLSQDALTPDQLEAVRLWIESGAPKTGAIPDEFGNDLVGSLLGACLPAPTPIVVEPLAEPAFDVGIQMVMPPFRIAQGTEKEVCFAEYVDFRDRIPARFLTPDGNFFYANGSEGRSDPNSHHRTTSFSGFRAEMVHAPEFGRWECAADGPREGEECDPLDRDSCGGGQCRSEMKDSIACVGFGPPGGGNGASAETRVGTANGRPGFFARYPSHGIFYWNSHAFNLTPEDLVHHEYQNVYFTEDLRFEDVGFQDSSHVMAAAGVAPFTKQEVCADYVLPRGRQLLSLGSHTHKRGERFTIDIRSTGERLYDNPFWDDPVALNYDPPRLFDSEDPADRTLTFCGLFNNGVNEDGSPDTHTVTRLSKKPARSFCVPTACARGRLGEPCSGKDDNAACDTSPGAGDGLCDACPISAGATSDDEMFVMLGSYLRVAE